MKVGQIWSTINPNTGKPCGWRVTDVAPDSGRPERETATLVMIKGGHWYKVNYDKGFEFGRPGDRWTLIEDVP